jgi:(p)ppGpp synthase/HD superfamily hydrolase
VSSHGLRHERGAAMVARVRLETAFALGDAAAGVVERAVAAALRLRQDDVRDDHDPRYLHPARTVLILLSDVGCRSVDTLAGAPFVDSVDAALAGGVEAALSAGGAVAAELCGAVPVPNGSVSEADASTELVEALISAPHDAALIALAERLDQVRHLQFRPELDWFAMHATAEHVYAPVARHLNPALGRRYDRWVEAFRRRLMGRSRTTS